MYDVVNHISVNGLRDATARRVLILENPKTLCEIKYRLRNSEACEIRVSGRVG